MQQQTIDIHLELISRLDRNGPRYTSYPTPDRFLESFGPDTYASWASRRNQAGAPRALVRRSVIQTLMCHFELSKDAVEVAHLVDFDRYFRNELIELRELEDLGLVRMEERWIAVTAKGRPLVRSICMLFDTYLRLARETIRYSRTI